MMFSNKNVILIVSVLISFLLFGSKVDAQAVKKAFKPRKTFTVQGDFAIIGSTGFDNKGNADLWSSAALVLPSDVKCRVKIVYAGLYWSGLRYTQRLQSEFAPQRFNGPAAMVFPKDDKEIFIHPTESYIDPKDGGVVVNYADITAIVKENGGGKYWFHRPGSGFDRPVFGDEDVYSGWNMVVVYEDRSVKKFKNISVYEGVADIKPGTDVESSAEFNIDGLKTIKDGNVDVKIGIVAGRGNKDKTGDYFQMYNETSKQFEKLKHTSNTEDNFFSSVITGTNTIKPTRTENKYIDIVTFNVPNDDNKFIKNGQTSTKFRFGTTDDNYALWNVVLAVDAGLADAQEVPEFTKPIIQRLDVCQGGNLTVSAEAKNLGSSAWEQWDEHKGYIPLTNASFPNDLKITALSLSITNASKKIDSLWVRPKIRMDGDDCWVEAAGTQIFVTKPGLFTKNLENIDVCPGGNVVVKVATNGKPVSWEFFDVNTKSWEKIAGSLHNQLSVNGLELKISNADNTINALKVRAKLIDDCKEIYSKEASITVIAKKLFTKDLPNSICYNNNIEVSVTTVENSAVIWEYLDTQTGAWKEIIGSPLLNQLQPSGFSLRIIKVDNAISRLKIRAKTINAGNCLVYSNEAFLNLLVFTKKIPARLEVCPGENLETTAEAKNFTNSEWEQWDVTKKVYIPLTNASFPNELKITGLSLNIVKASKKIDGLWVRPKIRMDTGDDCWIESNDTQILIAKPVVFTKDLSDFVVPYNGGMEISVKTVENIAVTWEYLDVQSGVWKDIFGSSFQSQVQPSGFSLKIVKADNTINRLKIRAKTKNASNCLSYSNEAFVKVRLYKEGIPFSLRSSQKATNGHSGKKIYHVKGDFTIIGNSNLNKLTSEAKFNRIPADPANIVNSSSADFKLPKGISGKCTKIVYAGLYWFGKGDVKSEEILDQVDANGKKLENKGNKLDKSKVQFKAPKINKYTELTADNIYYGGDSVSGFYTAYKDITEHVVDAGTGSYALGNIATFEGNERVSGYFGGWGMVIIYEDPLLTYRDIAVFDGFEYIGGGSQAEIFKQLKLSGFKAVQRGDVNIKMGMMAGEGDEENNGDYFKIKKLNTDQWESLSHGGNKPTNFFTSSIFTGGNSRVPDNANNYGADVAMFDLPNVNNTIITNNQTETEFRFGTFNDLYAIFNITFAVDAYIPIIEGVNRAKTTLKNDRIVKPGQKLFFDLDLYNEGSEAVTNGLIEIPLPPNVHYVKATAVMGGGDVSWLPPFENPNADPAVTPGGKIIWNIAAIPRPVTPTTVVAKLEYSIKISSNCTLLTTAASNCNLNLKFTGTAKGTGAVSKDFSERNFISTYLDDDCAPSPDRDPYSVEIEVDKALREDCPDRTNDGIKQFVEYCPKERVAILREKILLVYPAGTKFYSQLPGTEDYLSSQVAGDFPYDVSGAPTLYYAIAPGMESGCYLKLQTLSTQVTTKPVAKDMEVCAGSKPSLDVTLSPAGAKIGCRLFYFADETSSTPLESAPDIDKAGSFTYYVAEGVKIGDRLCLGAKVPFTINVRNNTLPVFSKNLTDFEICNGRRKVISVETDASVIIWEYYDNKSSTWKEIKGSANATQLESEHNNLTIKAAAANVNGIKIRVKIISANGCFIYSKEVMIISKNCNSITNPALPSKVKKAN